MPNKLTRIFRVQKGFVLLEVLLAAALLGAILVPILNLLVASLESSWFAAREIKAQALVREGWEALRSVRERNWLEINDGNYALDVSSGTWELVSSPTGEDIGPFNRQLVIEPAYRNESGEIVESGGTEDLATKKVTIEVSWWALRNRQISLATYLTRHLDNLIWFQTTQVEFDQGETQYTETTDEVDGEVQLEGGCDESPEGPKIYDEQWYNTWYIFPSAANDIRVIDSTEGEVYEGETALEVINYNGADTKLRNKDQICTLGFTRFEFWAYTNASVEQSFGIHGEWGGSFVEIVIPSQEWTFVSLEYSEVSGDDGVNLDFLFFKPFNIEAGSALYLDNITLAGGQGGYYLMGTFTSSVFDAQRETTFNRISYNADTLSGSSIGFQVATSNSDSGPWLFYGPGGTTSQSDLYENSTGEGIWLGNNFGQYIRYKAYLFANDEATETPVLHDVSVNYSP